MIKRGQKAPELKLTDSTGASFKLSSLKGKTVVLYFYPKADTPGCTTESCEFRDHSKAFAAKDAVIIGISPDTEKAQTKFQKKYDLPFTLLADADHVGAEAYGVWKEKSMYGRKYMGVARTTYLIGPDGKVVKRWDGVKVPGHAEDVLAAVQQI